MTIIERSRLRALSTEQVLTNSSGQHWKVAENSSSVDGQEHG